MTADLRAEVERLRRWKAEASPMIDGLQDLGRALGLPLGAAITGPMALEAAEQLKADRDAANTARQKVAEKALRQAADDLDGDDRDIPEQRARRACASYLREHAARIAQESR